MTDYQLRVKIAARGAETTTVPSVSGHMWVELVDTVNGTVKSFGLAPKDAGNPTGVGKVYTNDSEHYKEVYYTETFDLSKAQYDRTLGFANNSVKNPPYYSVLSWEKGNHCIEYSYAFMRVSGVLPDTLGFSTGNMNEPRVFSHEGGGAIPQFHTQKIKDFKYFYELSKNKDTYDGETDLYGIKINYFTDPANSQLTVRNNADGSYSHITKDAVYTYYDKTSGNAFTSRIEISSGNEKHTVYYSQKYNILTKTYDTSYFTNYKGGSYLINLSGDDKAIENFVIQNGKSILQNNIVIEYTVDAQNKTESYNRIIVKQDMLKSFSNTGVAVQHSGTNKTLSGEAWIAIKDTATIIIDGATYTAGAIVEASQVAYEALEQFAKNTVSSTVLTSSMNTALNATFTYIGTNYNNLNTLNVLKTFATAYGIANISTSITQTDLVKQIGHAINGTQLKASNGTWLKNTNGVELHTLNPEGYGGAIVNGLIGFGVTAVAFGNDWNSGDFATNGQTEIVNAIATEYVASSFDITQADASGIVAITSVVIRNLIANPSMNTSDIAGVAVQAAIAYSSYAVGSAVTAYFASAGLAFGGPIGALIGGLTGAVLGSVTKGLYKQPYYSDGEFATHQAAQNALHVFGYTQQQNGDGTYTDKNAVFAVKAEGTTLNKAVLSKQTSFYVMNKADAGAKNLTAFSFTHMVGGKGDDNIIGDATSETLIGNAGADYIDGKAGNNVIIGDSDGQVGNDIMVSGKGNDFIAGGAGDDYVSTSGGNNFIYLGDDDDMAFAGAGNDKIYGGEGDDYIEAGNGNNVIELGEATLDATTKKITGNRDIGHNEAYSGYGNDTITGGDGRDIIMSDVLDGTTSATINFSNNLKYRSDIIDGNSGNDTIMAGLGNDTIHGGKGSDLIIGGGYVLDYSVTTGDDYDQDIIYGDAGDDIIIGDSITPSNWLTDSITPTQFGYSQDYIDGGIGHDYIRGGGSNDQLIGGLGNDTLYGDDGTDLIWGNDGTDMLIGGLGNDTLNGGASTNYYYFKKADGSDKIITTAGAAERIMFLQNSFAELTFTKVNNDLQIKTTSGGIVTIANHFVAGYHAQYLYDKSGYAYDLSTAGKNNIAVPVLVNNNQYLFNKELDYRNEHAQSEFKNLINPIHENAYSEWYDVNYFTNAQTDSVVEHINGTQIRMKTRKSGWFGLDKYNVFYHYQPTELFGGRSLVEKINNPTSADLDRWGVQKYTLSNLRSGTQFGRMEYIKKYTTNYNDLLVGAYWKEKVRGYDGDDIIFSGSGNDGSDFDWVKGGDGNDFVHGGNGNDEIIGGAFGISGIESDWSTEYENLNGYDEVIYKEKSSPYFGGIETKDSSAIITNYTDHDIVYGGAGDDKIYPNYGNDTVYGGSGNDTVWNESDGNYFIGGGSGNDTITIQTSGKWNNNIAFAMILSGGSGNDTISTLGVKNDVITNNSIDLIRGGSENDKIYAYGQNDELYGDEGDDTIYGGKNADYIHGGDGNDLIYGERSNETDTSYTGGQYFDTLHGGSGNDTIHAESDYNEVYAGLGDDKIFVYGTGENYINGGGGWDTISYLYAKNYVKVDLSALIYSGSNGGAAINHNYSAIDHIEGTQFNDYLIADNNGRVLGGNGGGDTITGGTLNDGLYGGDGNDTITAGDGNDTINGDAGDDRITAGAGDDRITGGDGDDTISGDAGNDLINGNGGNDTITAGDGNDTINGDAGDDIIRATAGNDKIYGGDGNDTIFSGREIDVLDGGAGTDRVSYIDYFDGMRINLANQYAENKNTLLRETILNFEGIVGSPNHDNIWGTSVVDTLDGNYGDDVIDAYSGNDTVYGSFGNDTLIGGNGADKLYGGTSVDNAGNDTFKFDVGHSLKASFDTIKGFEKGIDKIDVSSFANSVNDFTYSALVNNVMTMSYKYADFVLNIENGVNTSDLLI